MKSISQAQEIEEIEEPGLMEKLEDFAHTNVKLFQYKAIDKGTEVASSVISGVVMAVFFLLGFVILSIGLALLIGSWLNDSYWGFFIMGGFYFLLGLLFYLFRDKWIKTPLINSLSKKFL